MLTIWDPTHTFQLIEVTRLQDGIRVTVDRTRPEAYTEWTRIHLINPMGDPRDEGCSQLLNLIEELLLNPDLDGSITFEGDYDEDSETIEVYLITAQDWFKTLESLVEKARGEDRRTYTPRKNYSKRWRGHAKRAGEGTVADVGYCWAGWATYRQEARH